MNNLEKAEYYLKGRGLEDVEINNIQLSAILNEFSKALQNPEKRHFNYYPLLYGIIRKHGYKDVTAFILHKYRVLKSASAVAGLFEGDLTKSTILRNLKRLKIAFLIRPRGGRQLSSEKYNKTTTKMAIPIIKKMGYEDIDEYMVGQRAKGEPYERIGFRVGRAKTWAFNHLKRIDKEKHARTGTCKKR